MTTKEEIALKLQRVQELARIIQFQDRKLITPGQRSEIQMLEGRLEFRLNELVDGAKIREADIKIEIYEAVVKVINQKHVHTI